MATPRQKRNTPLVAVSLAALGSILLAPTASATLTGGDALLVRAQDTSYEAIVGSDGVVNPTGGAAAPEPTPSPVPTEAIVEDSVESITAPNSHWSAVTYGAGKYVAVSRFYSNPSDTEQPPVVMSSANGESWEVQEAPARPWNSVIYAAGRFVALSTDGYSMTSTDGISWTEKKMPGYAHGDIAFGNGVFVTSSSLTGNPGGLSYSIDGINWTQAKIPAGVTVKYANYELNFYNVQFIDGKFLSYTDGNMVSSGNSVSSMLLESTDGINWTVAGSPPGFGSGLQPRGQMLDLVVSAGGETIYSTRSFDTVRGALKLYSSADRSRWTEIESTGLPGTAYLIGNLGSTLLAEDAAPDLAAGRYSSDIYGSDDGGRTWTQLKSDAAFGLGLSNKTASDGNCLVAVGFVSDNAMRYCG